MLFKIQKDRKGTPKPIETSSLTEQGWKEKDLENYLRENLVHLISDDLMVISQSRPFQPEADLLALDQNAELWFFELKKVATASDNLLQVMRYSQNAASLTVDNLNDLYSAYKKGKCDSLVVDFCEHFGFDSPTAAQQ
jgi:RecB family endonuclease NucS